MEVKTVSQHLALEPVVKQVTELEKLMGHGGRAVYPNLVPAATELRAAVYRLQQTATTISSKSEDSQLKVELPKACSAAVKASEQIMDASRRLRQQSEARSARSLLLTATQGVRTSLKDVLQQWDSAEVRSICSAAQLARDRLQLMSGAKSMRSLLLCFKGYADSMKIFLNLVDKRQKELVDKKRKQKLFHSLDKIKHALPTFSSAMQTFVKTQTPNSKETKNSICEGITQALDELIECVQGGGSQTMARNILEVKRKLSTRKRYSIGPDLDRHIDTIIENSKAVAHVSRDEYRETILRDCGEVLMLRKELGTHHEAVAADPGSARAKRAFDKCAKKLCEKLNELDRMVADSVVDQVTDLFVETSAPLNHLVQAATGSTRVMPTPPTSAAAPPSASMPYAPPSSSTPYAPPSTSTPYALPFTSTPYAPPSSSTPYAPPSTSTSYAPPSTSTPYSGYHSSPPPAASVTTPTRQQLFKEGKDSSSPAAQDTKKIAEVFRRHSQRLSQVAAHAAQSSTDAQKIKLIKKLATGIDVLTSEVVERAERVSRHPGDRKAKEELDKLRQDWARKVQELTKVIDDIIDPEDFILQSEANIQKDMEKCQAAMQAGKWEELRKLVLAIAAKARRALEVAETAVAKASDHSYRAALSTAVARLDKAIPKIVSTANRLIEAPTVKERRQHFLNSLQEVLNCLQNIQEVLGSEIDITSEEEEESVPSSVSSQPLVQEPHLHEKHATTAEEQMMKRGVAHTQPKPKYIGSLGRHNRERNKEQHSWSELEFGSEGYSYNSSISHVPTTDHSSQVEDRYISTNATRGSLSPTSHLLSPNSSTSTWMTPRSPTPLSPIRHAPPSPATPMSPPGYAPPSPPHETPSPPESPRPPSPPSHSPPITPRRPAPPSPAQGAVGTYVPPFQRLMEAAEKGEKQDLPTHSSDLAARVTRLTKMADSASSTLDKNSDLVKVIQTKSSEIAKLTPRILSQADLVSRNPQLRQPREEFQASTHQWAGNVRDLINAMQQANLPWSRRADQLLEAARTGQGLESQMEQVSAQTRKMVDVATMAIDAAQTEEAIGGTGDMDVSVDQELQEQVKLVRTKMSEIQKLTPQLLGAAEMAMGQPAESAASEHLHLLSQEWATNAKTLMKGVDDITLGMGGAADTLFLSAKSGDAGLQSQQTEAIKNFASSLQNMAKEAMEGCTNEEQVKIVRVVARRIEKLSTQLIDCAEMVAEAVEEGEEGGGGGGEGGGEPELKVQEDTELLRRDWSSQVHLLTAHIDDLTAEASAPLDRLVDLSLQANRTSGLPKQLLMKKFDDMATYLTDQLDCVSKLFADRTRSLPSLKEPSLRSSDAAIEFLRKLTPHAIGAAKSLESAAGSAMLEHFNHLRRQWATKAQFLLTNLKRITSVNMEEVIAAFLDLLHNTSVTSPRPAPSDLSDTSNLSGYSETPPTPPRSPLYRSYSSEVISVSPVTRFDFDDADLKAPSTPSVESHPKKKQHVPSLSEMGLRHVTPRVKRPTSMAVPLPSWATAKDAGEESNTADQIALAALSLRELTNEFMEESNPIVTVGKKMSEQMSQMAEFTRGKGELRNKTDMILTAKAVAANGQTIHRIANMLSRQCVDERSKNNLLCCAEMIPTLSTQLTILASVKTATPDDMSAEVMLVKNAQNLMQAVIKTVQAAEAACMKGIKVLDNMSSLEGEDLEAMDLAMSWKRKLYHQRAKEKINAPLGRKGLRKVNKFRSSTPSAVDVIKPSEADMRSPTKT